jgi:hypothetical protein
MAGVKISNLPAATVPLAGTEPFAIVQGGVTVQVPVSSVGTASTPVVGVLKGTGATIVAAVAGTDFVVPGGALGTPSSGVATNLTGTAAGLTAGSVTSVPNLTGPVTSVSNATTIVGPIPAVTLSGTMSGGGNQINNVVIGTTTPLAGSFTQANVTTKAVVAGPGPSTYTYGLQLYGTTNTTGSTSSSVMYRWSPDVGGPGVNFFKTRGTSATDLSAGSVVASGDILGAVSFGGSDGSGANVTRGAFTGFVDAAVSSGTLPTAVSITTGTTSGTERMRITSAGLMGIGTGTPASCAIVDVTSTTLGFKFPVMTTTQKNAIGTPVAGLVIFDSTLAKLCVYSGSAWQTITSV